MKKILVFVMIFSAFCYYKSVSEEHKKLDLRSESLFAKATTSDGRLDLSILFASNLLPEERREAYEEADKDGDGFLTQEEYDALPEFASKYEQELACRRLASNAPCSTPCPLDSASTSQPYAERVASAPACCEQSTPTCPQAPCASPAPASPACPFSTCDAAPKFNPPKFVDLAAWEWETNCELSDLEAEIYSRLTDTLEETLALQTPQFDAADFGLNYDDVADDFQIL